jgi:cystathionine beta-lyase
MRGFGGMVSLISSPVKRDAIGFLKNKLFTLAESLGGVESLANYSVMMAHIDSRR